jgi:HAD superfamily hydrolase (TIGR01459 family)
MTVQTTETPGLVSGLSALAGRYSTLFCDIWGVVHNGVAAHEEAVEALERFRAGGGRVVLVTNAPRPAAPIVAMLGRLGVRRSAWDAVVSSGDTTRVMVARYGGRVIHHVGPPTADDALYEGLDITRGPAEAAEAVVVTDLDEDDDTPSMYEERMALWLERGLPLICANPDKVVQVGERLYYCGGALADLYAERGGTVLMAGKPYAPIYEEALRLAEAAAGRRLERAEILAVGDSVRTDAAGAAGFGLDLLFVTGSIHAGELDAFGDPDAGAIRALVEPSGARMVGFLPRLVW